MAKKGSLWQEIISPCVVLTVICVVIVALLAVVNSVTLEIITKNQLAAASESRKAVVPAADTFEQITLDGDIAATYSVLDVYKAKNNTGYAITVTSKGYGGEIKFMVGLEPNGNIIAVSVVEQEETPGLGAKITEADFTNQYKNKKGGNFNVVKGAATGDSDIVAITGATISSKAATLAVNNACLAFEEIVGGAK
ncbi:MAG: RnfABCDGE type electron transport complex subunit G [Oscillospiraceae bacterium]|nr:RnfABCDGE type electron transport complex subunit G [Oscillospiraceae bacterium]